jgi:hypothetical protein
MGQASTFVHQKFSAETDIHGRTTDNDGAAA